MQSSHNPPTLTRRLVVPTKSITQLQQETERAFLLLEGLVYPELLHQQNSIPPPSSSQTSSDTERQLIADLTALLAETHTVIPQERDPVKRELARKRLEAGEVKFEELKRHAASRISIVRKRMNDDRNRAALFGGASSSTTTTHDGNKELDELRQYAKEAESIKQSKRGVDEIMDIGTAVLHSLGSQSEVIRRATDKVEGVVGSLGMSDSLLRAVRRRQWGDAMIVYGGMFLVTVILSLFYMWVHYW